MNVSIIIPAYNEEKRIFYCLDRLIPSLAEDYEVIISADGCTDKTLEIAKLFPVKVAVFHERLGKGGGILNALRVATGETIVITDSDLSTPPSQIPKIVDALRSADIVLGSRNLNDSVIKVKPPIHRILLGKAFNWLFRRLFKIKIFDTQCGFKAMNREIFQDLSKDLNIDGFAFDVDLIVKAHKKGYKILEMPIVWSYKKGSKVICLRQIFAMGRDMLTIWLETKKKEAETNNLKDFYDSIQGDAYEKAGKSWFLPRKFWHVHKNKEIVGRVEGEDVLDVGCGSGNVVERLLEKGRKVVGVDIGKGFVSFCQSRYKGAFFCKADAEYLPFSDECFDSIVCSEVIEHLENPEKALEEFNRVLRPEGKLIITTPNISFRWAFVEAIWTRVRRKILETRHRSFTKRRLNFLLDITGFSVSHNAQFMFGCLLIVKARKKIVLGSAKSVMKSEDYDILAGDTIQEFAESIFLTSKGKHPI